MPPKTKNNMNFQPEQIITDQSTLIFNFFVKNKDWGRGRGGGLNREGGLINFPPLKRGAYLRGGGLNRGFTVIENGLLAIIYYILKAAEKLSCRLKGTGLSCFAVIK